MYSYNEQRLAQESLLVVRTHVFQNISQKSSVETWIVFLSAMNDEYPIYDSSEIRELKAKIEALKNTCGHLQQRLSSSNTQINDLTAELENSRQLLSKETEQEIRKIASRYESEELSLIRQKEAIQKNIETEKEEIQLLSEKEAKLQKQIQERKQCNEEKETQSDNMYLREANLQQELDALEDEKLAVDEKKKSLEEKLEKMDNIKSELTEKKINFESKLLRGNEQIALLRSEIEKKEEELDELKAVLTMKSKSDMAPEAKSLFSEVDDERLDVEKQLDALMERHKQLKEEEGKRLQELQHLTALCNSLKGTKENAFREYKKEIKTMTGGIVTITEEVQNKMQEIQRQLDFLPKDSSVLNCSNFSHLEAMIIKEAEEESKLHSQLLQEKCNRRDLFEKTYKLQEEIFTTEEKLLEIQKENSILKIEIIKLGGPSL